MFENFNLKSNICLLGDEMEIYLYNVLFRWGHIVVGIAWIGLLYYFNFVQTEYVKVADPDAKSDVMKKLAPNALWWFRWAAFLTFLTGLYLLYVQERAITTAITVGSLMGIIMICLLYTSPSPRD